ncbi:MAG: flagellar assembly protein FliW [Desulfurivibrionaceae bacterium]
MMHAMATTTCTEKQGEITVSTSRFGKLSVNPEKVITMTSPFLGFPDSKRFLIKPHGEESPFLWLQSLDDPKLAFVVIQATLLIPQYQAEISNLIRQELQASPEQPLETLLILTIPRENPEGMTANLLGPVAINSQTRLAKQVLQDPTRYDACWPVFTMDTAE